MHEKFIIWILAEPFSISMAIFAFLLMCLYLIQFLITENYFERKYLRKNRLVFRAFNWFVFGAVFLFFGQVVPFKDLDTWRATARIALLFLMLPEIAYQLTILWPLTKRKLWKFIHPL